MRHIHFSQHPSRDHRLITVTLQPHAMACSIISSCAHSDLLNLEAYHRFDLPDSELYQLVFFNPSRLKALLQQFLHQHDTHPAFVACAVRGPALVERFVSLNTAHPHKQDFVLPELAHLLWDYVYLYPAEHRQWVFYVAGLPHEIILQCQLFFLSAQLPITFFTSECMSLLKLYEYTHRTAFRQSQLAVDMMQHRNEPMQLFTKETLHRVLHIPHHISIDYPQETEYLLSACGLFVAERAHA